MVDVQHIECEKSTKNVFKSPKYRFP